MAPGRFPRLDVARLACVIFCSVCGGAFGIETLVGAVGPGWAVVLILVTPLVWSLPMALMVAELSSAMPEEGGYYVWVRTALGPFWGIQEASWTLGYSVILMAIFPVMFVNYLTHFVPALAGSVLLRAGAALAVIGSAYLANRRGARSVGTQSQVAVVLILGCFGALAVAGLARDGAAASALDAMRVGLTRGRSGALLLGLSVVIFNYSGWDGASTVAEEVEDAERSYPRALAMALVATVLVYLGPVLAGIATTTDPAVWSAERGWPAIGKLVAGEWLGSALAAAALVSSWSIFNGNLLSVSRLPYVLARDGWLPRALTHVSDAGVPTISLAGCAVLSALLAFAPFANLVVLFVLLYAPAIALEFLALAVLRVRQPDATRPFRVPGGRLGIAYVCFAPLLVAAALIGAALREPRAETTPLVAAAALFASGVLLYSTRRQEARLR